MTHDRLWAQLDSVRPESDDLAAPEMSDAAAALGQDESLRQEFARRQAWDRQIAVGFADVPMPVGLKERLLSQLDQNAKVVQPARSGLSRRRWLSIVGATAAGITAAAFVGRRVLTTEPGLSLAGMCDLAIEVLRSGPNLPAFTGRFTPQLPSEFSSASLRIVSRFYGLASQEEESTIAVTPFVTRGAAEKQGILLVVPTSEVADPPTAESIFDHSYVPSRVAGVETAAWREGEFVYVCAVNGTIAALLHQLDRPAV